MVCFSDGYALKNTAVRFPDHIDAQRRDAIHKEGPAFIMASKGLLFRSLLSNFVVMPIIGIVLGIPTYDFWPGKYQ